MKRRNDVGAWSRAKLQESTCPWKRTKHPHVIDQATQVKFHESVQNEWFSLLIHEQQSTSRREVLLEEIECDHKDDSGEDSGMGSGVSSETGELVSLAFCLLECTCMACIM